MSGEYQCRHDDCGEAFDTTEDRLAHAMEEHWDNLDPGDYPTLTGRKETLFD